MEPIDKWREEFERFFDYLTDKNYGVAYYLDIDGKYCFDDIETAWQSFLAAKHFQPIVELPRLEDFQSVPRLSYNNLLESITAAGIQYRIKGE